MGHLGYGQEVPFGLLEDLQPALFVCHIPCHSSQAIPEFGTRPTGCGLCDPGGSDGETRGCVLVFERKKHGCLLSLSVNHLVNCQLGRLCAQRQRCRSVQIFG